MKLAVSCVLAVSVVSLMAMLFEGCKRDENNPPVDTNDQTSVDTNQQPLEASNPPVVVPPISTNATAVVSPPMAPVVAPAPAPAPEEQAGSTYVVVKGDTLGKIAKAHGVSLKDLEAANPNVQPSRLRIGASLNIPASANGTSMATGSTGSTDMSGEEVYVVKSGDTLTRIAHTHGTTVKALESENNLSTTKIKVGQKLKIPASAEPANTPVNAPPAAATAPAPAPMAPAPAPATNSQ